MHIFLTPTWHGKKDVKILLEEYLNAPIKLSNSDIDTSPTPKGRCIARELRESITVYCAQDQSCKSFPSTML